jgi:hypothetical protein
MMHDAFMDDDLWMINHDIRGWGPTCANVCQRVPTCHCASRASAGCRRRKSTGGGYGKSSKRPCLSTRRAKRLSHGPHATHMPFLCLVLTPGILPRGRVRMVGIQTILPVMRIRMGGAPTMFVTCE